MRILAIILVLLTAATAAYFAWWPQSNWHGITEGVGEEAIRRTGLLKKGMPEKDVFRTLGLDGYGLQARSNGSGPPNAWPTWYLVTRHQAIMIRWNLWTTPPTLDSVSVEPVDRAHYAR